MIQFDKPLCGLDLECTGIDKDNDRIVEFALVKLFPDGSKESKCYKVNPGIPIPIEASEIHGIYDKDIENCPSFAQYAPKILKFIEGCDIATFNGNSFDLAFIYNEFVRCGRQWDYTKHRFIDAGNIFKIKNTRTLSAASLHYLGKPLEGAHGALSDTECTMDVLFAQIEKYKEDEDFPTDVDSLSLFSNYGNKIADISGKFIYKDDVLYLNFGKNKGQPADADISFIQWMMRSNFPPDTMAFCEQIVSDYFNQ